MAYGDMVYGDCKDLGRRTVSDKVLRDKTSNIAKIPKCDGFQRVLASLASMVYNFFDKKSSSLTDKSAKGGSANNEIKQNEQLAEELQKPIVKKIKKIKVYSLFKDTIWGAGLVEIQLISKFNRETRFLLCVINIFSKYAWVAPLKDEKGITIINAFQKILDNSTKLQSTRKTNKIWVHNGSEL